MVTLQYVFVALFGMAMGSFLNVLADRLPAGGSVVSPPSHCDSCGRRLAIHNLIPVFSFLWQKGRCPYCGMAVPRRVLWVEVLSGLLFLFAFHLYGIGPGFMTIAVYGLIFLLIGVIDLEHQLILDMIVYPAVPLALALNFVLARPGLVSGLIGAAAGVALMLVIYLVSRGGMGMGDVKMAALIGATAGFPFVFVALFLGMILGGVAGGLILLLGMKKRKDAIPFGPFLSLGAFANLVAGKEILGWYVARF
ncbi:MAG: prepilin peptidase [Chloroflexi bacterium]|nr:prepilin peptidase [Chloroflexota bacterium]